MSTVTYPKCVERVPDMDVKICQVRIIVPFLDALGNLKKNIGITTHWFALFCKTFETTSQKINVLKGPKHRFPQVIKWFASGNQPWQWDFFSMDDFLSDQPLLGFPIAAVWFPKGRLRTPGGAWGARGAAQRVLELAVQILRSSWR